ncbi:MAG: hypothetical protein JXQ71_03170 [Verrucomicrobia bacterium]|nr:hypothetical protein [Verrucomicrobiota bacterium]
MVYRQEIASLEQEKRWLIAQGDLQRVMLALELRRIQTGTDALGRLLAWRRHARLLLVPGAAAAAFLLTRRRIRSWLMRGFVGWTLWHRTRTLRTVLRWIMPRR